MKKGDIMKNLEKMLKSKKGFRTEAFSGSGVDNPRDIIRFEFSMGNTDIIDYVNTNYNILNSYICDDWDELIEVSQENASDITDEIIDFLTNKLKVGEDKLKGLWLAGKGAVRNVYGGEDSFIDEYSLDRDYVIISSLGYDGSLFIFKEEF